MNEELDIIIETPPEPKIIFDLEETKNNDEIEVKKQKSRRGRKKVANPRRGFASMTKERLLEVASKGGKTTSERGTFHAFTPGEASAAGKKGGASAQARGVAHRFTPEEASIAGQISAKNNKGKKRPKKDQNNES